MREPAVIFTEYRDTLDAIVAALSASARRVGCIHGGLPADPRRAAVDAFNDGRIDVLVATDAAGEGLNLHHRCRLVIDVELPWSPLRLEQRIGRVDRLGQQRTVHGIRLFHPGTIEAEVLEHLRGQAPPRRIMTSRRSGVRRHDDRAGGAGHPVRLRCHGEGRRPPGFTAERRFRGQAAPLIRAWTAATWPVPLTTRRASSRQRRQRGR